MKLQLQLPEHILVPIRALALSLSAVLAQRGIIDESDTELFVGGAIAVVTLAWLIWSEYRKAQERKNVKTFQAELNQTLSDPIPEDGRFGPVTKKAAIEKLSK